MSSSKYESRSSPPYSATEYPDDMMEGNDGNMYISQKRGSSKSFRWYKAGGFRSIRRSKKKFRPIRRSKKKQKLTIKSRRSIKKVVKTRKSPLDSATKHPDKKMKGLDGNMYISEKRGSSKSFRWYKITHKKKLKKSIDNLGPCKDPEKIRSPVSGKCISVYGPTAKKLGLSKPKNDGRDLLKMLEKIPMDLEKKRSIKRRSTKRRSTKKISTKKGRSTKKKLIRLRSKSFKDSIKKKMSKVKEVAIVKREKFKKYKYKHPKGISVILANSFDNKKHNAKGWWISEKLDGIRAYWDYKEGELFTRNGSLIYAPDWFIENFPKDINLDGELWIGRGKEDFNLISGISRKIPFKKDGKPSSNYKPSDWDQVKYLVFDVPDYPGPYEDRVSHYNKVIKKLNNKHIIAVETWPAKSNEHVIEERIRIEDMGGEGIMLRKPGSKYDKKRSSTLLKVKSFMDAEARVVGHNKGAGKYSDVLGALVMETIKKDNDPKLMKNGAKFTLSGMNDYQRVNYKEIFPIGTIITYKYFQLSKEGVPRFPSFIAVRKDS